MKRVVIGLLTAGTVSAGVYGFAATMNVGAASMGAGDAVVASCQDADVTSSYETAWNATSKTFEVSKVTVTGLQASCNDHKVGIALTGPGAEAGSTVSLWTATGATSVGDAAAADVPFVIATGRPAAEAVTGVQVVLSK